MAPEIYKQEPYNFKCDIWSLGIIFYEFLYGKTPWKSPKNSQEELVKNIMEIPLIFPEKPEISDKTKRLLRKMLEIDQDKRIDYKGILEVLKAKKKKMKEKGDNLAVSMNQNVELLNKYPLVENCYINTENTKNNGILKEKDGFSQKNCLINKKEMVLLAKEYSDFHLNIANFLRKVLYDFERNKKLVLFGIKGDSLAIFLLFLKKMELIVIFQMKKMMENEEKNEFLTKEFYDISYEKTRLRLLKKLNDNFNDSLNNFRGIYEESGDFPNKKGFFNEDFEYNEKFCKNYKREFRGFLKLFEKHEENDKKTMQLMVEISICQSFDELFGFFQFERGKDNCEMFYKLYEDLKNPEKLKNYITKRVKK